MASTRISSDTDIAAWTLSDKYHNSFLIGKDQALEAARKNMAESGLPDIAVSEAQGKYLYLTAKTIKAKMILEVGTLGGYSTIWFARALPDDGEVVTLELVPKHVEVARANIEAAGMTNKTKIIQGDARQSIAALRESPSFDLIFIDANHEAKGYYFQKARKLIRKGGVIIVDNVVRQGKVADEARVEDDYAKNEGIREIVRSLKGDAEFEATTIATVGEKGFDGFLYCLRE